MDFISSILSINRFPKHHLGFYLKMNCDICWANLEYEITDNRLTPILVLIVPVYQ